MSAARRDLWFALALFLLAIVPYVYFYGGWGANQEVNLALARAIVERRTFAIDDFTPHEGDIASGVDGHVYSNKAPGYSALVAVPYALRHAVFSRGILHFDDDYWPATRRMVTRSVSGICGALIAPLLFLYGRRRLGVSGWSAAVVALSVAFATIVFPYSTMLFAHTASAFFLLLAFCLLRERPLLAGISAGLAGSSFFLTGIAAAILALLAWSDSRRSSARFVAGGLPFALALGAYQWACFGSPFVTPVERSGGFTDQSLVLGVFGSPGFWSHLGQLLFSEYRGLFFSSPVLLFALWGGFVMVRDRRLRPDLLAIASVFAVFVLINASFNGWHGGAAFGPRYLLPVVPLLAIPMMLVGGRLRPLWLLAGAAGLAFNLAATAVDPMPLDGIDRPLTGYILPKLLGGPVPADTWRRLCLENGGGACPPGRVALWQGASNAGERFFGQGSSGSVVPAVLWIVIGSWVILGAVSRSERALAVRSIGSAWMDAADGRGLSRIELRDAIPDAFASGSELLVAHTGREGSGDGQVRIAAVHVVSVSPGSVVVRGLDVPQGAEIVAVVPADSPEDDRKA